ncbi:MAG: phage tail protein [Proteobacteria bacterium]|nr:phage tail protein [Pseudomonadota bacterium]
MTLQNRSYTSGHFELQIDGHTSSAYLKSIDGGHWKGTPINEAVGPDNVRVNHRGILAVEPFTMELGLAGAGDILRWIQASWNKKYTRRNGVVRHADFDLKSMYEHEFFEALITETTFPKLDGASKEAAYLKLKIHPERVATYAPQGRQIISGKITPKQKMWVPSAFRLNIDGVRGIEYTNQIEAFTIKQDVTTHYVGEDRYPSIEPNKIEFPTISGTIALDKAGDLLKWWEEYTSRKAKTDKALEKSGSIEFLSTDRKSTKFSIDLYFMNLKSLSIVASTANSDQIKRVKFELTVHEMKLDTMSGLE